jgi:lysozyme
MRTSQKGIDIIKRFEGLHDGDLKQIGLQPKKCPAGIWTEGYGHAMRDDRGNFLKGSKMPVATITTEAQAVELLKRDLEVFERIVSSKIKTTISQEQFDALVSHTYNTGGSDTLFKLVNRGAPESQIRKWFISKYITASGTTLRGLIERRTAEANLFFS